MISEKIQEDKEPDVFTNPEIPEEQVTLDQEYNHCVYVMLWFKKEFSVDSKE